MNLNEMFKILKISERNFFLSKNIKCVKPGGEMYDH